jgi:hypothetical protein
MRASFGRLSVLYEGYDDDARPLWDIPEAKRFVIAADSTFPHWFFVSDLRTSTLHLVLVCLCMSSTPVPGVVKLDGPGVSAFIERESQDLLQLCRECGITESATARRLRALVDYLEGLRTDLM